jgi:hypothetical protein
VLGAGALDVAGGCGLEAVSLCSAVRGDAGAEGERKWGNNGGRSEDGEECYPALPFVGCWLTAEDDAAGSLVRTALLLLLLSSVRLASLWRREQLLSREAERGGGRCRGEGAADFWFVLG